MRTPHTPCYGASNTPARTCQWLSLSLFFREAILMMELPIRHAASPEGSRFAPNKSSVYGGRPWTGPSRMTHLCSGLLSGQVW